jgi:rhomboid protease GluP
MSLSATAAADTSNARSVKLQLPVVRPLLTYALLVAIIAVYVVQFIIDQTGDPNVANPILAWGVLDYGSVLVNGEWYRLLSAMFLHLSPAHIFFNAYALWRFGSFVEMTFGHIRFGLIYFLGGLSGSLASLILGRGASAGASGAIFAIFAAEIVFLYYHRELLGARASAQLRELLILAGVNLALGIISNTGISTERIDNWDHIGGFFGGLALAALITPHFILDAAYDRGLRIVDKTPFSTRWPLAIIGALVLVSIAFLAARLLPLPI